MITGRGRGRIKIRITVRPPRRGPLQRTQDEFEPHWSILCEALDNIYRRNASTSDLEKLYRASYKIALKRLGHKLHEKLAEFQRSWIIENLVPEVRVLAQKDVPSTTSDQSFKGASELLHCVIDQWKNLTLSAAISEGAMMYMDRVYVSERTQPPLAYSLESSFRDNLLYHPIKLPKSETKVIDLLFDVMFNLISLSRSGHSVDKKLIRACVTLLKSLYSTGERTEANDLYQIDFEPRFIAYSQYFFFQEVKSLADQSASTWLQRTGYWLKEEAELCRTVIWGPTYHALIKVVESQLIDGYLEHHATNLKAEIETMFRDENYDDLRLLYRHIQRVDPRLQFLRKALTSFIIGCVADIDDTFDASTSKDVPGESWTLFSRQLLREESLHLTWATEILQLERKITRILEHGLDCDPILNIVQSRNLSNIFENYSQGPRCLSLLLSSKIRSYIASPSNIQSEDLMDAVALVQYIPHLPTFQYWYKDHLSHRLISHQVHSMSSLEIEQVIIDKLRVEINDGYANELERMLEDAMSSHSLSCKFADTIKPDQEEQNDIELSVSILTHPFWPSYLTNFRTLNDANQGSTPFLPPKLAQLKQNFEDFYSKRKNRRLIWPRLAGTAEIACSFLSFQDDNANIITAREYRFEVPTCFMVVMLLFNDLPTGVFLSFSDIQHQTKLPAGILVTILAVLSEIPEMRILLTRRLDKAEDEYNFNEKFVSQAEVVKIPTSVISSSFKNEDEISRYKELQSRFEIERLEACIVRIMKSEREMGHERLMAHVMNEYSIGEKPEVGMVKKRVNALIEREYMERVFVEDHIGYRYIV
ncbi:Cullin repeat-containing protein [Hyaloscypha hepaticicola]|uniref:Cullin repeat-containing protein n=1 Tax=Hyaloscypha hepaticicola TaxID=2082293 RepID=A0A2J6PGZ4_9HELO|nr:Cullin repeat-containing protein [Hyaloscypha hepaticicola]